MEPDALAYTPTTGVRRVHETPLVVGSDESLEGYGRLIDDPKIFTKPWTENWQFTLHPEWEKTGLYEMVCNENNRCPGGQCVKQ